MFILMYFIVLGGLALCGYGLWSYHLPLSLHIAAAIVSGFALGLWMLVGIWVASHLASSSRRSKRPDGSKFYRY